jgi:hypothetical protein
MNKLDEILILHDIDSRNKAGGTDKNSIHTYTDEYEKHLSPYVGKNPTILEIGVWEGGSALLWQEFLNPKEICAIDIDDYIKIRHKLNSSFKFYHRNAYIQETVELIKRDFPDGFDIIIEDGVHTIESNEFALKNYLPMLKSGGIMIIEDVPINTPVEIPFGFSLLHPNLIDEMSSLVPFGHSIRIIDLTKAKGRYDDILFIIKKP